MKNRKYLPLKRRGKGSLLLPYSKMPIGILLIKNAFRYSEKLPYLFTFHSYLLLSKKSVHAELVKSEE